MTTRSVALLVNPTAGRGRGARWAPAVEARLRMHGFAVQTVVGADADDARRLSRIAVDDGVDAVIAVGGDGMVHLAVQLVAGTEIPLGIVAAGTGNDFARLLGIHGMRPEDAADEIAAWRIRQVDAGRVGERWFAGVMSSGFDSAVNERANRMRWPTGRSRYNIAIAAELGVFKAQPFRITLDGRTIEREAMLVAVGNGVSYGGGMKVCPGALVDDGSLAVTVLGRISKLEFLRVFPRVYAGTHVDHPAVDVYDARVVGLEAPAAVAYADGEQIGPLPVTAECVPCALQVLVPSSEDRAGIA